MVTQFVVCHSTCLFFTPSLPSHSIPLFCSTTRLCWHLHSSVGEKKTSAFFPWLLCCFWLISLPTLCPVSSLHQWNIEESTEHVSNPHVCCWVLLQGKLFSFLQFGGACVFGLWVVCGCVLISVQGVWLESTLCEPSGKIITAARNVCPNVFFCVFVFARVCLCVWERVSVI